MEKPEKTIKIEYDFNRLSLTELFSVYLGMSIICLIIAPTLAAIPISGEFAQRNTTWLYFELGTLIIPAILLVVGYRIRRRKRIRPMFIKQNGKKIIGTIVSLDRIELDGSGNSKHFSYTIEYENPENGKIVTMTTPAGLKDRTCVHEKDLPLDVTVYVYKDEAFAEEIINPPIIKISFRRFIKWLPIVALVIVAIVSIALFSSGYMDALDAYFELGFKAVSSLFMITIFATGYDSITNAFSKIA